METKDKRSRIDIRVSKKEKEQIEELAQDRGMTVSEFIRQEILGRKVTVRYKDQGKY